MNTYAIIEADVVVNIVVWDGDTTSWAPAVDQIAAQVLEGVFAAIGYTYANGGFTAPVTDPIVLTVAQAQAAQIALLTAAYEAAITAPISYTSAAGATGLFSQTEAAKTNLQNSILASEASGAWKINLWQQASGAVITPFTYADLQGLAAAMGAVDAPDYQTLLTLIAQVNAATTVAAVQDVAWT